MLLKSKETLNAGYVVIKQDARYRLRPSVSIIPTKDKMIWEFFQSNTRRIRHIKIHDISIIEAIRSLNGNTVSELIEEYGASSKVDKFISYLYDECLIEDSDLAIEIKANPYNRLINFIADYFPTDEALKAFQKIRDSHVLIIGVGAVGSWIGHLLAQSGVGSFTLCDPDVVKPGNLNRSLFFYNDIGKTKVSCVKRSIQNLDPSIKVDCKDKFILDHSDVEEILEQYGCKFDLVINASDYPNVDTTSEIISKACMKHNIPHIIAGGYNLHLSLIGPTIIPYMSPCFQCIKIGLEEERPVDFTAVRKLHRAKRNIGNLSPLAGISASFSVFEAIRVLVRSERLHPIMTGRRGEFNFLTSKLNFSDYSRKSDCEWCGQRQHV
jgi:molybdopterin-synthase adenylyltransferase